jgi:hypothetical protein
MDENEFDFCMICECVVDEGNEHDFERHGSNREYAKELEWWKKSLRGVNKN